MTLEPFKRLSVLAKIVVEDTQFATVTTDGRVWEDSQLWYIIFDYDTEEVKLFHKNSGTHSRVKILEDGRFIPGTFRFLPKGQLHDEDSPTWMRRHIEKIGIERQNA